LHTRGRLGVVELVGGAVESGVFVKSADDGSVDGPGYGVGLPVDFVGVPVFEGVGVDGGVFPVVVYGLLAGGT